jgi:putative alpha-1,2-mannosidase
MEFKTKSLGKIISCSLVILMLPMSIVNGNDAVKLNPVDYINPIIGTNGTKRCGRTIPGPYMPFGMVQLSPDTRTGRGSTNGYNYRENTIEGFSVNHMSGVGWHGTLGNFQIMPTTGELRFHSGSNEYDLYQSKGEGWKSEYSHAHEIAEAGYPARRNVAVYVSRIGFQQDSNRPGPQDWRVFRRTA